MENSLTPLARALRKFCAGKPISRANNTPLGAVTLAAEQRERLRKILENDKDIQSPSITHAAVTVLLEAPGVAVPFDDLVLVEEGTESEAVRFLEAHIECGNTFTVAGLSFVVQAGDATRVFQYRVERTPDGDAALRLTGEKLIQRRK
jgi:hypothetical protein